VGDGGSWDTRGLASSFLGGVGVAGWVTKTYSRWTVNGPSCKQDYKLGPKREDGAEGAVREVGHRGEERIRARRAAADHEAPEPRERSAVEAAFVRAPAPGGADTADHGQENSERFVAGEVVGPRVMAVNEVSLCRLSRPDALDIRASTQQHRCKLEVLWPGVVWDAIYESVDRDGKWQCEKKVSQVHVYARGGEEERDEGRRGDAVTARSPMQRGQAARIADIGVRAARKRQTCEINLGRGDRIVRETTKNVPELVDVRLVRKPRFDDFNLLRRFRPRRGVHDAFRWMRKRGTKNKCV